MNTLALKYRPRLLSDLVGQEASVRALSNALRGEIFRALDEADQDPNVRVMILRGAWTCFSSGYDLSGVGELPWASSATP